VTTAEIKPAQCCIKLVFSFELVKCFTLRTSKKEKIIKKGKEEVWINRQGDIGHNIIRMNEMTVWGTRT
jgi:hypothetical protein